jgi:hypothetical protein
MKTFKCILTAMMILSVSNIATAQDTEEIILTTYYPAPYGDYDEITTDTMAVNRMAVGSSATVPSTDGVIGFSTISSPPAASASTVGDMYFDGDEFKYYKETSESTMEWVPLGTGQNGGIQPAFNNYTFSVGTGWTTLTLSNAPSDARFAIINTHLDGNTGTHDVRLSFRDMADNDMGSIGVFGSGSSGCHRPSGFAIVRITNQQFKVRASKPPGGSNIYVYEIAYII